MLLANVNLHSHKFVSWAVRTVSSGHHGKWSQWSRRPFPCCSPPQQQMVGQDRRGWPLTCLFLDSHESRSWERYIAGAPLLSAFHCTLPLFLPRSASSPLSPPPMTHYFHFPSHLFLSAFTTYNPPLHHCPACGQVWLHLAFWIRGSLITEYIFWKHCSVVFLWLLLINKQNI